ncbi:hypothetical protein HII17_03480 [Thalassotalea sp. M1531]|uniref:Thiosulfate reductase n=1 Tax=Thalassotalea algicola TaxID=2716224 RepID=A0A7Y0LAD9_9GAMM|nr:cytochrome C oxidase subunit IV family protein [Thalassotalea algicola]NMP30614.1 hypothetical protein [Thalassotalea algicola]
MNTTKIIASWFILITLTLLSVFVGQVIGNHSLFLFLVLAIVSLKGQQIIDIFMELKEAPRFWRLLLLSYVLLVPAIILVIYLL